MITEAETVARIVALEMLVKWLWMREFKRTPQPDQLLSMILDQIAAATDEVPAQRSDAPMVQETYGHIARLLRSARVDAGD